MSPPSELPDRSGDVLPVTMLDFTGYVLRWDEGIRWALVVGTNLLKTVPWIGDWLYQFTVGGVEPGFSSLERFCTWHVFVLTLGMIILGGWHIFRVRRDGGVAVPHRQISASTGHASRVRPCAPRSLIMAISGVILLFVSIAFWRRSSVRLLRRPLISRMRGHRGSFYGSNNCSNLETRSYWELPCPRASPCPVRNATLRVATSARPRAWTLASAGKPICPDDYNRHCLDGDPPDHSCGSTDYKNMRRISRRDFLKIATDSLLAAAGILGFGGLLRYLSYKADPPPPRSLTSALPRATA